jgi:membrane fusion protein, multidrug efflux system
MAEKQIQSDPGMRRTLGRLIGTGIVVAAVIAVIVALVQWQTRPQTDDATVRANFVGIAPQVNGYIVELHVRDNQQVKEGDLLFLIDPRPYEIALQRARATLALTRREVDGLKNGAATAVAGVSKAEAQLNASAADVTRREMDPVVADAEIARLEAQFQHADDHLKRLEPLLPQQFVSADRVEQARTQRASALAALNEARARKNRGSRGVGGYACSTRSHRGGFKASPQRALSRPRRHR